MTPGPTTLATENLLLSAPEVAIEAGGEPRKPRLHIVAYTGGLMNVPGWGDVAIRLDGLDASGQVPLLADHDARVSGVVGHGEASVVEGRLIVAGVMSGAGEAARQIVEMTTGGFAFQASVGVEPVEHERVAPGSRIGNDTGTQLVSSCLPPRHRLFCPPCLEDPASLPADWCTMSSTVPSAG